MSNVMAPISANALWPEALAAINGGGVVRAYATPAAFRAETDVLPDNTLIRILSPEREYRYSSTSGAGWADDGNTILRQTSVPLSANGRAFSTAQGAVCPTFDALRGLVGGKQDHVHLQSHTSFGDGGGGIFDRRAIADGDVDDNGTKAIAGDWVYVRRNATRNTPINVAWFGVIGDGVTPCDVRVQAILDSMAAGEVLYFPRGRYIFSAPLSIPTYGITLRGDGKELTVPGFGTTLQFDLDTYSGTGATISDVTAHDPAKDNLAVVVTLTGLTGIDDVEPGDTIRITGAALERNNGYFTIMSVSPGTGTLTYYGFNLFIHLVSWDWRPAITGETNNGILSWEIRKNSVRCYTRNITFHDLQLFGDDTCSSLVDGGFAGAGGVPDLSVAHTAIKFYDCRLAQGWIGAKCGDFSGYASGGCTSVTWPGNCDLYVFENTTIADVDYADFLCVNPTGNSMLHSINNCDFMRGGLGVAIRRGSVTTRNLTFSALTGAAYCWAEAAQPNTIIGGSAESVARMAVVGLAGYLSSSNPGFNITFDGFRGQPGDYLPADKCFVQLSSSHGVSFKNCLFIDDEATIGVYSYRTSYNTRAPQFQIENCIFQCASVDQIVTAKVGAAGAYPAYYYSQGNMLVPTGTNTYYQIPDGIRAAYGNPANTGVPYAEVRASYYNRTAAPVALPTNAVTTLFASVFHGLKASSAYHCTAGARCVFAVDSDPSICGAVDEVVDLYVTTDANRVATAAIIGTQAADASRLPAGLSGATISLGVSPGGVTLYAARPSGVACTCAAKIWVEEFEEVGL